jgi:hypothetical protein
MMACVVALTQLSVSDARRCKWRRARSWEMSPLRARPEGEANSQSMTPIRPRVDAMARFGSWKV